MKTLKTKRVLICIMSRRVIRDPRKTERHKDTRIFGIGKVRPNNATNTFKVSGEQIMRNPFIFIKKVTELLVF